MSHLAHRRAVLPLFLAVILLTSCQVAPSEGPGTQLDQPATPSPVTGDTAWSTPSVIATPLRGSATSDIALGDLTTDAVTLEVPQGALDGAATVTVSTPTSVPEFYGAEMEPLGSPVDVSVGAPIRLDEKATVTFKFDPAKLGDAPDTSFLRVAYFDGARWEYLRPETVDLTAGTMTLGTYHFSLFGATKIKDETVLISQWAHSQSLDDTLREQLNDASDEIAGKIVDLALEKMGVEEDSVKSKVLGSILKDDEYREIADAYAKGDVEGMNAKFNILVSKKIAENVPESVLSKALGGLAENAEDLEAVSKAAGFIAGGQYEDAARVIGEQIADKFLITTAGKIAVEVINHQIESWKDGELEAAYTAYRDGANGVFFGYNVDAKDFDAVWSQMRGIGRQLEIDAIKAENAARKENGMPPLSSDEEEDVRADVKESLQRQFEDRSDNEAKLKDREEKLMKLGLAFKDANFFDSTLSPAGLDKFDFDGRLEVLNHFAKKMLEDTGRTDFTDKTGLLVAGKVSYDDIVQGARLYFGSGGKKAYQKYLSERFGVTFAPELKDLEGPWGEGEMVITDVYVNPEARAALEAEGCDVGELEEQKGKKQPFGMSLRATSETTGELTMNTGDGKSQAIPFTYEDGVITASKSEEGATMDLDLNVEEGDDGMFHSKGSLGLDYKGMLKITGGVTSSKPTPKPAAPAPRAP